MQVGELIALVPTGLLLAGSTLAAVSKLTRLVDAVERLTEAVGAIAGKVDNHEDRLRLLESTRARRRAP